MDTSCWLCVTWIGKVIEYVMLLVFAVVMLVLGLISAVLDAFAGKPGGSYTPWWQQ